MKKWIFIIIVCIVGISVYWYINGWNQKLDLTESAPLSVQSGDTILTLAKKLEDDSIIADTLWFRVVSKLRPEISNIKAGVYEITPNMSYKEFLDILQSGKSKSKRITFLEGWRINEYLDEFEKNGYPSDEIAQCLKECSFTFDWIQPKMQEYQFEGYLYPDTYEFMEDESAQSIINKMLRQFEKKAHNFVSSEYLDEKIILASMIEREVRSEEDRKIVSGIMQRRLSENMRLDIDATVLYVLGNWKAPLSSKELALESPYNTRKFKGLPPSAICNPSLSSIEAAFQPTESEFLFYLNSSTTGETFFAKTLDEHNQNKYLHIK